MLLFIYNMINLQGLIMNKGKITFLKPKYKSIYLLPNIVTTIALCFGFLSIVAAVNNEFDLVVKYILFALLADGLDGRIARITNTQTEFGKQYDSLSDLVSFGIVPAIFFVIISKDALGHVSWAGGFFYMALTAIRLARFNLTSNNNQGLPCPSAAVFLVLSIWLVSSIGVDARLLYMLLGLSFALALLMISHCYYPSFKSLNLKNNSYLYLILTVLVCSLIVVSPFWVIWWLLLFFILSGPCYTVYLYIKNR